LNREKPFIECQFQNLRISILFEELSRTGTIVSIRKQIIKKVTLIGLLTAGYLTQKTFRQLHYIVQTKANFLIIGGTSSGKTTLLQAMLNLSALDIRTILIEDTPEISLPNDASISLITRIDPSSQIPDVSISDLMKRALRMRPDRLVIGEVRGEEAKSLLLALSSGHDGSAGTLHARNATSALIRLEMLIQMGAPEWNINAVRQLIASTINYIIEVEKFGHIRRLSGIYKIESAESTGITLSAFDEITAP
jgi:pilus assembly protein CpaF